MLAVGRDQPEPALLTDLASGFVIIGRVTLEEFFRTPPAGLSSCDAIWVTDELAAQLAAREVLATALLARGVRLIYAGATSPSAAAGKLADWPWVRPGRSGHLWVMPPEYQVLESTPVLEPAISRVILNPLVPGRPLKAIALLVTPSAILLVLLARLFVYRAAWLAGFIAAGLSALTIGALVLAGTTPRSQRQTFAWTNFRDGSALAVREDWIACQTLFRTFLDPSPSTVDSLLPSSSTAEEYLSLTDVQLRLTDGPPISSSPEIRVHADLPGRHVIFLNSRRASIANAPPGPTAASCVISGGYVAPVATPANARIFAEWLPAQDPLMQPTLRTWYALRCRPDHRYRLDSSPTEGLLVTELDAAPTAP